MSSQMVLFGQMLINKSGAICQIGDIKKKKKNHFHHQSDVLLLILNGRKPRVWQLVFSSICALRGNFIKYSYRNFANSLVFVWTLSKESILEVDYPPICKYTMELQWIAGGSGCVFDRK